MAASWSARSAEHPSCVGTELLTNNGVRLRRICLSEISRDDFEGKNSGAAQDSLFLQDQFSYTVLLRLCSQRNFAVHNVATNLRRSP